MVDLFEGKPYSFGALRKTFGPLYVRCDVCRRFALLKLGPRQLRDVDYRTRHFSCSVCGAAASLAITDPRSELGMSDYRLDQRPAPERHPAAIDRLVGERRRSPAIDPSGGELPGRKRDPRR